MVKLLAFLITTTFSFTTLAGVTCYSNENKTTVRLQLRPEVIGGNITPPDLKIVGFIYFIQSETHMIQGTVDGVYNERHTRLVTYTTYHLNGVLHFASVPMKYEIYLHQSDRTGDDKFYGFMNIDNKKLHLVCTELSKPY
jgi:hypothetical protein